MTGAITIRSSTDDDAPALRDLALLDGGVGRRGAMRCSRYVDGELRAAVSRADGGWWRTRSTCTADLVELLRARAAHSGPVTTSGVRRRLIARSRR